MSEPSLIDHGGVAAIAAVVVTLGKVLELAINKIRATPQDGGKASTTERLAALEARMTAHEAEDRRFYDEIKGWLERLDRKLDRAIFRREGHD